MKKLFATLSLGALLVFAATGVAFAQDYPTIGWYPTHGNFSVSTEACAGCHVTHTATAAKLLKSGATQTAFCYTCHSANSSSPYDVDRGIIDNGGAGTPQNSTAGKFGFLYTTVTSRHNVDSPTVASAVYDNAAIPGNASTNGLTAGFKCGSCHDPHAGDLANARLLKGKILGDTNSKTVTFTYDPTNLNVTGYAADQNGADAINGFCGLCHGRYNVGDNAAKSVVNSTYQVIGATTMYRHAIGVPLANALATDDALYKYLGAPSTTPSATNNYVLCLTCHVAHGTTALAPTGADSKAWSRDPDASPTSGTGSTLLRMDKRGVCYDCHGAATSNLERYNETNW